MSIIKPVDPVQEELDRALTLLARGEGNAANLESEHLDLKEEAGSRGHNGRPLPVQPQSEDVARQLAKEAACFANTPGGGVLIVGVSDDGTLIGARSDAPWLRHRIYQLTNNQVTPHIAEYFVNEVRLLVSTVFESLALVPWNNKSYWRVGPNCQPVDPTTWQERRKEILQFYDSQFGGRHYPDRATIAVSYAQARGRISSSELASLVGANPSNVGATLRKLAAEGILRGSNSSGRGQGFHYLPAHAASEASMDVKLVLGECSGGGRGVGRRSV